MGLTLCETDRLLLADLLTGHDGIDRRVQDFDQHIDSALADYTTQCRLLETMPGIDHTSACAIFSEMGPDPSVFGAAGRLAAWAGLCPGNNKSAGRRRSGHTRRGSRTPRASPPSRTVCGLGDDCLSGRRSPYPTVRRRREPSRASSYFVASM